MDNKLEALKEGYRKVMSLVDFDSVFEPSNSITYHIYRCAKMINTYPELNDYLEEYLKYNSIDERSEYGSSALHYAVNDTNQNPITITITILIGKRANVNLQNKFGYTPLHRAAQLNSIPKAKMLILADADVFNIKNCNDNTPYDYMSNKMKEALQIDYNTKTIGILSGKLTKAAIKK